MMYYFLFNGPHNSGKSTAAREAVRHFTIRGIKAYPESIAGPMKQFMSTLIGLPYSSIDKNCDYHILTCTVREALIDFSEEYLKVRYGDDFLGRALVGRWYKTSLTPTPVVLVIDDCGFESEFEPISRERSCLIRVLRPKFDFTGDSRNWVPHPDRLLLNDTTINDLYTKTDELVDYAIARWKIKPSPYEDEKKVIAGDEES